MKKFEIPSSYRSPIISAVKSRRKQEDPRKKDFTPTRLDFGRIQFLIARHFGFCYGVENAIEIAYKAVFENPGKRIFLLSQMIHNPGVNADLESYGIQFIQDTSGKQLIEWDELKAEDIVIIPAFGTTVEIENKLKTIGIAVERYNTTCPFVEKVWNRSETLGKSEHTIIIHGKFNHEETRATLSHSSQNAPALVIKDLAEATLLGQYILGEIDEAQFSQHFQGKSTKDFNPAMHLTKIGVVNQTTMLASETQEITEYLRQIMIQKYGEDTIKNHIADTRDTLCYATNDNQSATYGLLKEDADFALVIGGYNSSNTTHLVELLEQKFPTYFVNNKDNITALDTLTSFNIHIKSIETITNYTPEKEQVKIIITSGASCPDAVVEGVIEHLLNLNGIKVDLDTFVNTDE